MKYIIFNTNADYLQDMMSKTQANYDVNIISVPRTTNFISKIFLGLHKFLNISIFHKIHLKLLQNKPKLEKEDVIIVFDSNYWIKSLQFLRKKYKNKIVFWYWNPVSTYSQSIIKDVEANCDSVFTYNLYDSKKYGYKFHSQFYWDSSLQSEYQSFDFLFIGRDKGRSQQLLSIYNSLIKTDFKPKFYVISNDTSLPFSEKKYLSYAESKKYVKNSKCLIEFSAPNNFGGLSLRALESLFNNKKLITNDTSITDYSFYSSNNILVYTETTTIDDIIRFMELPSIIATEEILNEYSSYHWLQAIALTN